MEGAEHMVVIPVDIGWNDIGSWASLFEALPLDQSGNIVRQSTTDPIHLDTQQTLVFSQKLVVTIGVENLVVIETPDAILVCHKDRTQDVKEVVNQLRAANKDQYL
jgi:mannose-1-phosphate guanylyltransferase